MQFPYPLLVADIGGTNVRMALADAPDAPLADLPSQLTASHAGLAEAVAATGARPRSILACAAGPVVGRTVKLTNANWTIDGPAVAAALAVRPTKFTRRPA